MDQFILFALTGLGIGAVFAVLAMGLIITYKGTGVINFAAGVMGLWSGYIFSELRTTGDYVFPVVFVRDRVHIADDMNGGVALGLAVLTGTVLGVVAHLLIFRPLRNAPALAKVVASAGLMLAMQALIVMRFGSQSRTVVGLLPNERVEMGDIGLPRDRLWLALIAIIAATLVAQAFRRTRTGLAIRAGAENQRFIALASYSPDRLAATAWAASSGLIAMIVVLGAPITGLNPVGYTLFVVPALACALMGKLSLIAPAVLGGFLLGIIQSETTFYSTKSWWPDWATADVASTIPFIAVIIVLFSVGRALPARDAETSSKLPVPKMPQNRKPVILIFVLLGVGLLAVTGGSYRYGVITSLTVSIIALSFVVLTGLLGQVSFAQAAFAGIAGFTLSKLTTEAGLGFPLAPLLSALGAGFCGVIAGLPALRIRGAQLAVVTLALALALDRILFSNPSFNNEVGNKVVQPRLFGIDLAVREGTNTARFEFGILVLVVFVLAALAVSNWTRGTTGRRFLAVRSNERASASLGVDVTRTKLLGFVLASFLAGLGGTLLGYGRGSISAESFTTFVGISYLIFAYLGGISSVSGAVVAGTFAPLGLVYVVVNRQIPAASEHGYLLLSAIVLILTAIHNPDGIAGGTREKWDALRRRMRSRTLAPLIAAADPVTAPSTTTAISGAASHELNPRRRDDGAPRTVFAARGMNVRFGGLCAVADVTLEVRNGQIVGLIGANGAGKTTFIDAASGFVDYTGTIELEGVSLNGRPAHLRSRAGLARTWQSVELINDLSVEDNLQIAVEHASLRTTLRDLVAPLRRDRAERVAMALDLLGLTAVASSKPSDLSLGEQKLINVGRALVAEPKMLLLDEPAAGLSSSDTEILGRQLRRIVHGDLGALLVEHDVALVLSICDYVYVLDFGTLIAQGTPDQIRNAPAVVAAYLGVTEDDESAQDVEPSLVPALKVVP